MSNYRTEKQLDAILDEASHWTVNGRQGQTLCSAASLRRAIDRAHHFWVSGAVVIAICRQPCDNVIIFADQIERLRKMIEVPSLAA